MPAIRNEALELAVSADGAEITLANRATGTRWALDPETRLADGSGTDRVPFGPNRKRFGENQVNEKAAPAVGFKTGSVEPLGDRALVVTRQGPAGRLALRYELCAEGLRVTAIPGRSTVTSCTLPGAFRPEGVAALPVALAKNQGVWHRGTGAPFSLNMVRNGHGGWSMPFFATVGAREALLAVIEDEHDARVWFEKTADGRVNLAAVMDPSLGRLGYDRSVLLRFVAPEVTSICKDYRRLVRDRGEFVSWEEKIAARPAVEKLFGALMCFIGYCQDPELDYAAGFRALRKLGFDRAYVYPLAIGNLVEGFLMGGRPPIDIRRHLGLLDELGYLAAGWMWTEDVPEQPENLLLDAAGKSVFGWQIEQVKWFRACPVRQVALSNRIQDGRMQGFTAQHFDVTASRAGLECFHPDHPLDRRSDAAWRLEVMGTAARRGCVISSEGLWGYAAGRGAYDVGSVKIPVPVHPDWFTVPMTSLVYHDSLIHDWWEPDNYNNPHHRDQGDRDKIHFPLAGGGWQELQAAQDALMGAPPNVMPFGAQYAFVAGEMFKGTELYRYNLEMPEVRRALELALPVARLHRRIGKLQCVSHQTLAADGSVQATAFADGTRVAANFSAERRELPGLGAIEPRSWKAAGG